MRRRLGFGLGLAAAGALILLVVRRRGRDGADDGATPAPVAEVGLADGSLLRLEGGPPEPLLAAARDVAAHLAAVARGGEAT